jgi:S-ribosylhomocysteine lyase LuxS involved in autoinducer biosynthesis
VLIVVLNVQFHLFQEVINQFTVVIVLENTNQMILVMIDHYETTEVQDILETTEVQDILETTEVQDIPETTEVHEIQEIILDQVEEKVINF